MDVGVVVGGRVVDGAAGSAGPGGVVAGGDWAAAIGATSRNAAMDATAATRVRLRGRLFIMGDNNWDTAP